MFQSRTVNNYVPPPNQREGGHIVLVADPSSVRIAFFTCVISSPEPKAHGWANSIPVTPLSVRRLSSVRQHFQTSSPLKPLGQLNSNFIWRLLRTREQKFVQMILVTWPRWPPCPYIVKTLKKSLSPEPEGRWPWDLVCSIGGVGPTKFVQIMILGWPWPT